MYVKRITLYIWQYTHIINIFLTLIFQSARMGSCAVSLPLWALQKLETFAAYNQRITELQNILCWKGPIRVTAESTHFFPPRNKLASRICLNFLFKHAGDRMGIKWLCALWSYRKSFVQPHLVCLSVRHRLTPLTRFGIRENFLPSDLGREKEPWDI